MSFIQFRQDHMGLAIKQEEIHCLQAHDVKEAVHELTANSNVACFSSQGIGVKIYNWSGVIKHINFNKTVKSLAMFGSKLYCGCTGYSILKKWQEVDLHKYTAATFYSVVRKILGKQTIHSLCIHNGLLFAGGTSVDGIAGKEKGIETHQRALPNGKIKQVFFFDLDGNGLENQSLMPYFLVIRDIMMEDHINSLVDSIHGGSGHEGMVPLEYQLFASAGAINFPVQETDAWKEKIKRLDLLLTSDIWCQIKAFLNQWLTELTNNETLSLQHQVQAVTPLVLQQYSSDTIQKMLSDVSLAISSLTNRKTRDQIMILNSKRCRLGIVDHDVVELNNLHRQIIHTEAYIGQSKVESAAAACHSYDIPLVSGAAIGLEGQLTVYNYNGGPCYRCLFPTPPPTTACQRCSDSGVLGIVPGIISCHQALEAIKIASDVGEPLSRRMLLFDALTAQIRIVKIRGRSSQCEVCGENATFTKKQFQEFDYKKFTQSPLSMTPLKLDPLPTEARISGKEYKERVVNNLKILIVHYSDGGGRRPMFLILFTVHQSHSKAMKRAISEHCG
ncbi:unnamed protein product [Camellia sinensis]